MKLTKKMTIICLACLAVIASMVTFLSNNYLANDIANIAAIGNNGTIIASLPITFMASIVLAAFFYILRLYKYPFIKKRLSTFYMYLIGSLSLLGIITSILTGTVVYGSFLDPYPFTCYTLINLILHSLVFISCLYAIIFCLKRVPEDEGGSIMSAKHIFITLGWVMFAGFVFNRFGALLFGWMFIQWRTLYFTLPFYMSLAIPMFIGAYKMLVDFELLTLKKTKMFTLACLSGLTLGFFIYNVAVGFTNTTFISAISACLPLERLASLPIELPLHLVIQIAVLTILWVQLLKKKIIEEEKE